MAKTKLQIRGTVDTIGYKHPEKPWAVVNCIDENNSPFTAKGPLNELNSGEKVLLTGYWDQNEYGMQFCAESYQSSLPDDAQNTIRLLSHNYCRGIGPERAIAIVEALGPQAIQVLDANPRKIYDVQAIPQSSAKLIENEWEASRQLRPIVELMRKVGLGRHSAKKLYKYYGPKTLDYLNENPYRLCYDFEGIPFTKADAIALELNPEPESPMRVAASIKYALQKMPGNTVIARDTLIKQITSKIDISSDKLETIVDALVSKGKLVNTPLGVALRKTVVQEQYIAKGLAAQCPNAAINFHPAMLGAIHRDIGFKFDDSQVRAIKLALEADTSMLLTGGPGCGKSTISYAIIALLKENGISPVCIAPTGIAAKNLAAKTRHPATTIHMYLAGNSDETPSVVLVDESSMIDSELMATLIHRCAGAKFILVGDPDQLPPIGQGRPFADALESSGLPCARLESTHRQDDTSSILQLAQCINTGRIPPLESMRNVAMEETHKDYSAGAARIVELASLLVPSELSLDTVDDIQIIAPLNDGPMGVNNLNTVMSKALNTNSPNITLTGKEYRAGDKVLQTVNNYEMKLMNGELGKILTIDKATESFTIQWRGHDQPMEYPFATADQLSLGWAISIHKAQGSEAPCIILALPLSAYKFLSRPLLYTAVTRAKTHVYMVGSKTALSVSVLNKMERPRITNLPALFEHVQKPASQAGKRGVQLSLN